MTHLIKCTNLFKLILTHLLIFQLGRHASPFLTTALPMLAMNFASLLLFLLLNARYSSLLSVVNAMAKGLRKKRVYYS